MTRKHHLFVVDPTAFAGGSKVATENILRLLDSKRMDITVLTADRQSWNWSGLNRVRLYQPKWLAAREQGIPYFLRHLLIALNVFVARLRFGRIEIALGASGPGVDLAIYLARPLLGFRVVQLIHGPVARSRTIGRCLQAADEIHYLESAAASMLAALSSVGDAPDRLSPPRFRVLENGLPEHTWPSRCQSERPVVFWAASLLKWKGLETLVDALQRIDAKARPQTHICYIRPRNTALPVSQAPITMDAVNWYEKPARLDELRAAANIFVSTSTNEPFGLSILEAMAAGHCVLIPADGAYWDRVLTDGIDCIKYSPGEAAELATKLLALSKNMDQVKNLGAAAARVARGYRAGIRYAIVKTTLQSRDAAANAPVGVQAGP